jgi:uncharacterized membrane protein YjgN (DUF898 family)
MTDSLALDNNQSMDETAASAPNHSMTTERISFAGNGTEYFGIWIVNILLTIITLGIYSAWAKVRKTRYFYDNTSVAGTSFEYHGNPVAILKGRIIAILLVAGYQLGFRINLAVGFTIFALLAAIFPWLVWKSLQFKLYNSSFRGIRFGFGGSLKKAYVAYLLMPIVAVCTLYLGLPFAHHHMKKFQHDESRFGTTHFSFHATVGNFYKIYLIGFLATVAGLVVIGIAFGGTFIAMGAAGGLKHAGPKVLMHFVLLIFSFYAWLFLMVPLFMTLTQNLIWNNTRLGDHQFRSEMKWGRTTFIALTNVMGIIVTFGLYIPFAQIRALRNRLESVSLVTNDSLDHFLADAQSGTSAFGEGMSDLLDFDISL